MNAERFAIDELEVELLENRHEMDAPALVSTCTGIPPSQCTLPHVPPKLPPSYCYAG